MRCPFRLSADNCNTKVFIVNVLQLNDILRGWFTLADALTNKARYGIGSKGGRLEIRPG